MSTETRPKIDFILDPELAVDTYICEYILACFAHYDYPLHISSNICQKSYYSDENDRRDREKALCDYLKNPPQFSSQVHWGRTMVAEKTWEGILNRLLHKQMQQRNWQLKAAPTELDHSRYYETNYYKKGTDYLVVERFRGKYKPILGIDLTIGGQDWVDYKRTRYGLHWDGFPVIILPVRNFKSKIYSSNKHYQTGDFNDYCDKVLVPAIRQGQTIPPLFGLDEDDRWYWARELGKQLDEGIRLCREGIVACTDSRITSYSHLKYIHKLLQEAEVAVNDYQRDLYR